MTTRTRRAAFAVVVSFLVSATVADHRLSLSAQGQSSSREQHERTADGGGADLRMSGSGRLARMATLGKLDKLIEREELAHEREATHERNVPGPLEPDVAGEEGPTGGQAETSMAVDSTGQHVVVGMNDTRGFGLSPVSVSGFAYSDDGGLTFTDGGQLPVTTGTTTVGTTVVPQVFGDPEVKYLGGSTFIYFSIVVARFPATGTPTGTVQTMGFHRSTDFGHTWQGPFIITPASNPHGQLSGGNAFDAADKEFADVDPETGRVMMTWSNFTSTVFAPGGVEISSTFSDNVMAATPTWSARRIVAATASDGQDSVPRFARGSSNVYTAWMRVPNGARNIGFARSTDNGVTWSAPVSVASDFVAMDEVLGNDRVNNAPSLAVDTSGGPNNGNIYLTYANNNNLDGADVMFQRSANQGTTFSAPIRLDSRPGTDRAQWFPWATVDSTSGRVYVFFYDQGAATTGDLTETMYVFSDDGGVTFSKPMPLTDRPFHAGYGNDTGQPNIGDYNQAVAQGNALFAVWAGAPPLVAFTDGQPATRMTVPDMYFKRVAAGVSRISASLGQVSFTDTGGSLAGNGSIDPGEQISFTLPLTNYVSNPLAASALTGVNATLSTSTPNVIVTQSVSGYPNLAAGATAANATPFTVAVGGTFVSGTRIDFTLTVSSAQGSTTLLFTQATGTPLTLTLLSQDFNGVVSGGNLPIGWVSSHQGGTTTVAWTTRNLSLGATPAAISNAAFHTNNGLGADPTRFERLTSPQFVVPASAQYATVDFDIAYDTEDDPGFATLAYDGLLVRFSDETPGRTTRVVAAEAFAEQFKSGTADFYPKHFPRNDNPGYLQDLSAWSGDSRAGNADPNGYRHVQLKLPGIAGSTARLLFEYTQDNINICTAVRPGHACGVLIDNIVVRSVTATKPTNVALTSSLNPSQPGQSVTFTATVTAANGTFVTDGNVTFRDGATVLAGPITLVNGQASFTTSTLAAGSHTITASYTSTSGQFAPATGSVTQLVAVVVNISVSDVSLTEGASGTPAATFTVSLSQPSFLTVTVQYATHDGSATVADFDYVAASGTLSFAPGEVSKPVPVTVFGDARFEPDEIFGISLSNPVNGVIVVPQALATIVNDDPPGPVVNDTTVNQGIVSGAERLRLLQNPDGGWYFTAPATNCGRGPGVSCPNTIGVTALALLAAYQRTSNAVYLNAAIASGNAIVAQFNATPTPGLPHTQDVEFLAELAQISGNTTYSTTATAWFQVVKNTYGSPAVNVDQWLADRDHVISHGARSLAAWDLASLIRTAKAAGDVNYALGLATAIVQREADWKDTNPLHRFDRCSDPDGCGPADNKRAFDYTLIGEGSLLWAVHDLPGFDAKISEYRAFLLTQQDPAGSWGGGNLQRTAYIALGLAAVGSPQAQAAIRSAMAYYLSKQLPQGGWPSLITPTITDVEVTEIDSEIARAMFTLFNTQSGTSITVNPAQLSSLTFTTVTSAGMTSVFGVDPARLPALPGGYTLLNGLAYQVTTTASIAGTVTICFNVPWITDAATFDTVRILQTDEGRFVDRTILAPASPAPSFDRLQVCARTETLEPFAITTRDVTPPTISVTLSPSQIWPPNGKMVIVTATIAASDDADAAPRVELVSIASNDANGRGAEVEDAAFGTDDRQFKVRASPGAVYTVVYRAIDAAGNMAEAAATVEVGR
ncbi:MAG TPA: Ig-like domain repeat protein [Vicinamibacterales bacterium]|nr:Ig-like domain repeat protein [Vicinamibacterales bacterium]